MAQAVLAREDPRETFLKNLPAKAAPMEVIYPVSWLAGGAVRPGERGPVPGCPGCATEGQVVLAA